MNILRKKVSILFSMLIFALTFTACGSPPETSIHSFFKSLKSGDIQVASQYLTTGENTKNLIFDDEYQKKLVDAVFSKVDYEITSTDEKGGNIVASVKITSSDLPKIYATSITELLPTLFADAFSENTSNKKDNNSTEELISQYFLNAINSPDSPKITSDIKINLVKKDENWLIEPNDDLLNALTGNFTNIIDNIQSE